MRFIDKLTLKGRRQASALSQNAAKLDSLNTMQTNVKVEGYGEGWQPAKPLGGNFFRHRVWGAILVLFNKADYIRWW